VEGIKGLLVPGRVLVPEFAGVAQSVEHLICNQGVGGSNPFASSSKRKSGNEFPAGSGLLGGGAAGFSNALHSELFRRAVISRSKIRRRDSWFPWFAKSDLRSLVGEALTG
jgi:hypothetical protein